MRKDHHQPLEPVEEPPFCDRCGGHHCWTANCPVDDEDDDDE